MAHTKRLVFTFGTLYPDDMIEALLGSVPQNFYATLTGYSVYKGNFTQLPARQRDHFTAKGVDPRTFSYLFAKEDSTHHYTIDGRAYYVDVDQELILDHWEMYPDWYRKKSVQIVSEDHTEHDAYIYTLDIDGERLEEYTRVSNDPRQALANARATRKRVMEKFPTLFTS